MDLTLNADLSADPPPPLAPRSVADVKFVGVVPLFLEMDSAPPGAPMYVLVVVVLVLPLAPATGLGM